MQENSRVKKYAELRSNLTEENKQEVETPKLARFAKRLNNIDQDYFQPIVEDYEQKVYREEPSRSKSYDEDNEKEMNPYFQEDEIIARSKKSDESNLSDDELLDNFLKEIRSYNQEKGVRSMDDTRLEILKRVKIESNKEHEQKNEDVKEKIKEIETEDLSETNQVRNNIAKQVRDLLATTEIEISSIDEEMQKENITSLTSTNVFEVVNDKYLKYIDEDRESKARLLEETQQLRLKMSEHEDELDEIGTSVDYTRKLLNVLIGLLIITILIAGGILVYLVMKG